MYKYIVYRHDMYTCIYNILLYIYIAKNHNAKATLIIHVVNTLS